MLFFLCIRLHYVTRPKERLAKEERGPQEEFFKNLSQFKIHVLCKFHCNFVCSENQRAHAIRAKHHYFAGSNQIRIKLLFLQ